MTSTQKLARVLLASDFSKFSKQAYGRVAYLPLSPDAEIRLVYVLPNLDNFKAADEARAAAIMNLAGEEKLLKKSLRGHPGVKVSSEVLYGKAPQKIVEAAEKFQADLLVMGRKGIAAENPTISTKAKTFFFGSIAERVTYLAQLPILFVNKKASSAYKKPICAFGDQTEEGTAAAVGLLGKLLDPKTTELRLLHAWHIPFEEMMRLGDSNHLLEQDRKEARTEEQKVLDSQAIASLRIFDRVTPILREGDARRMILEETKKIKSDLVILSTHGRAPWLNSLLETVTRSVISSVSCDVLLLKLHGD